MMRPGHWMLLLILVAVPVNDHAPKGCLAFDSRAGSRLARQGIRRRGAGFVAVDVDLLPRGSAAPRRSRRTVWSLRSPDRSLSLRPSAGVRAANHAVRRGERRLGWAFRIQRACEHRGGARSGQRQPGGAVVTFREAVKQTSFLEKALHEMAISLRMRSLPTRRRGPCRD